MSWNWYMRPMATSPLTLTHKSTRWPGTREWLLFALQALLVIMIDVGNDIFRGNIRQANTVEALHNARDIVAFETAHGLFIEPGTQMLFERTQHILGLA